MAECFLIRQLHGSLGSWPDCTAQCGERRGSFSPFKTTQSEVGAKVDFGHITATLAAFTATRPTYGRNPDTLIFGEVGKTRYQGIEFTTFGQATESNRCCFSQT